MAGPPAAPRRRGTMGAPPLRRRRGPWLLPPLLGAALPLLGAAAAGAVTTTFLDAPVLRWAQDTGADTGGGNAVAVSADGAWLFLTTRQGDLHVLATNSSGVASRQQYSPSSDTGGGGAGGGGAGKQSAAGSSSLASRSGPALVAPSGGSGAPYAVYAVQDADAGTSDVLAVDADAQLLWTIRLDGLVAGAPVVSARGDRVYVAHNLPDDNAGQLSVIGVDPEAPASSAALLATLTSLGNGTSDGGADLPPLTAPTLRTLEGDGGGEVDVLLLAADDQADPTRGGLYLLRAVPGGDSAADALDLRLASEYPLSALARPALARDARSAYLGQVGARVAGWDGASGNGLGEVLDGTSSDIFPAWEKRLDDPSSSSDLLDNAIDTPPLLSSDESLLFVTASVSGQPRLFALDVASGGSVAWTDDIGDSDYADPVVVASADGKEKLYLLERSGTLRQFHALSGSLDWEVDLCAAANSGGSCGVAADFGVAAAADTLYFIYTNGTVAALQVAEMETPAPTASPMGTTTNDEGAVTATSAPTRSPTGQLRGTPQPTTAQKPPGPGSTASSDTSSAKDESSTEQHGLGLPFILGTICGGLVLLIAVTMYIACHQKDKGKKSTAGSKWKPEDLDEAYRKECEEAEIETLREIHSSAKPSTAVVEVVTEEAPKPEAPVNPKAKYRWLRKAKPTLAASPAQDEENTHASSASPMHNEKMVELSLDQNNIAAANEIDTSKDLCANSKALTSNVEKTSKMLETKPKPVGSLSNEDDDESLGSQERPMSPVFVSDLLSVDSSIYFDDASVAVDKFAKKDCSLLESTIHLAERSRTSDSKDSEWSCPLDERMVHKKSECNADDDIDEAASQEVIHIEKINGSVGSSNLHQEQSIGSRATLVSQTEPDSASRCNDSASSIASKVLIPSVSQPRSTPSDITTTPSQSMMSQPHLDRPVIAVEGAKLLDAGAPQPLQSNTGVDRSPRALAKSARLSELQTRDSISARNRDGDLSERRGGDTMYQYNSVNSARPKAGIFTRNQKTLPSSEDANRETVRHSGRSARPMPTPRLTAGNYLQEREARVIFNPEPERRTKQSLTPTREAAAYRHRDDTKSYRQRRQTDPDGQKVPQPEGYDSAISNAWSSFMSELAKAEEEFFNPKLGSKKNKGSRSENV